VVWRANLFFKSISIWPEAVKQKSLCSLFFSFIFSLFLCIATYFLEFLHTSLYWFEFVWIHNNWCPPWVKRWSFFKWAPNLISWR